MHNITLIVPTETEQQRAAAGRLREKLAEAGGYSEYDGRGVWRDLSADGALVAEQHARIEVFTEDPARIRAHHYEYGREAGEAMLARIVDGRPELVPVGQALSPAAVAVKTCAGDDYIAERREE